METRDYKEIIRFLEKELKQFADELKQKSPTSGDVEVLKCMLSGIAKAETILAMRGEGEYSEGNGWYYQDGESYRRGMSNDGGQSNRRYAREDGSSNDGGQSERSSYRRGRYRRDDGQSNDGGSSYHDEDMYEYLRRRSRSEQDDRRRSAYEDMMRMMEGR